MSRVRRFTGLVAVASLALACTRGAPPPDERPPVPKEPGGPPRLVVPVTTHDFGTLAAGAVSRHVFVLRNEGGSSVHLLGSSSSCACLLATPATNAIPPGGEVAVECVLATAGHWGVVEGGVLIVTDDPALPHVNLRVAARVPEGYRVGIAGGCRGPVRLPADHEAIVRLDPGEEPEVRLLGFTLTNDDLRATLDAGAADAPLPARIRLVLAPDGPQGAFDAWLRIRTTSRLRADAPLRFTGARCDRLEVMPFVVLFWPGMGGGTREVTLRRASGQPGGPVRLAGPPVVTAWLAVQVEERDDGLVLRVGPRDAQGGGREACPGTVVATTTDGLRARILCGWYPGGQAAAAADAPVLPGFALPGTPR